MNWKWLVSTSVLFIGNRSVPPWMLFSRVAQRPTELTWPIKNQTKPSMSDILTRSCSASIRVPRRSLLRIRYRVQKYQYRPRTFLPLAAFIEPMLQQGSNHISTRHVAMEEALARRTIPYLMEGPIGLPLKHRVIFARPYIVRLGQVALWGIAWQKHPSPLHTPVTAVDYTLPRQYTPAP